MVPTDNAARKALPLFSGVLKYFPDALLEVAEVSRVGNEQHNAGQPLHWAREKSRDEADSLSRHLLDVGTRDTDGVRHASKVAWRGLALLQREIERELGYDYNPETDKWERIDGVRGECWEWPSVRSDGYGQVNTKQDRGELAHRLVWEALNGPVPTGQELHHECCNKRCVCPSHLRLVTRAEHLAVETRGYCKRKWFGPKCPTCGSERVTKRKTTAGWRCKDCDAKRHLARKQREAA